MDEDVRRQLLRLEGEVRGIKAALGVIIGTIVNDRMLMGEIFLRLRALPLLTDETLDPNIRGGVEDALDAINKALAKGG